MRNDQNQGAPTKLLTRKGQKNRWRRQTQEARVTKQDYPSFREWLRRAVRP